MELELQNKMLGDTRTFPSSISLQLNTPEERQEP